MSGALLILLTSGAPGVFAASLPNGSSTGATPAAWQLKNDGTYSIRTGLTGSWVSPNSAIVAAYYQVKVDVNSGSFTAGDAGAPSDSTGVYLDMSSSRIWYRNSAGVVNFNVSFREKATGLVRKVYSGVTLTFT